MTVHVRNWRRSAAQTNANLRRKMPLLVAAGAVPLVTPEQQQARWERHDEAFDRARAELEARFAARAAIARARLAQAVSADELAELDKKRGIYPKCPSYAISHWNAELKPRGLRPVSSEDEQP